MNQIDLNNRSAVITGAAQGIGKAAAIRFLNSGARVAIWDRDAEMANATAEELSGLGDIKAIAVDITDADAVVAAAKETKTKMSGIDILVNNAGINGPTHVTWEYPIEDWLKVVNLDLNAVFYCCRSIIPMMIDAGYGRIVNVASIAGKEGNPNASAYSASKSAVIGLTKSLGKELCDKNVIVNCVTPAAIRTAIFDQMQQSHIDYMLSKIPMGRFAKVEEAAAMITWLASEECTFSTGAVFDLSGGRATY